jgi:hypothetical protein
MLDIEISKKESNGRVVGNDQPPYHQPSADERIRFGAEEFQHIEKESGHTWDRWRHVIVAVLLVDDYAMREAETAEPKGGRFNKVVGKYLRYYGLDRIHKSDRSRMRRYAGKLEIIDAWRAAQPPEKQLELNHPRVVYNAWLRSLPPSAAPNNESESTEPDSVAQVLALLTALPAADATKVLAALGLDWVITHMPADWPARLQARVRPVILRAERAKNPNMKLKNLRLVVSNPEPPSVH